ncbi:MAG TPA: dickkopf-related protein [Myxococcota bacterium]|nr:dickkopf-related protein [Myxococcota bacterium]
MKKRLIVSLFLSSSLLIGCSGSGGRKCDPGTQGCECLDDGSCTTAGMVCVDGLCVSDQQPPPDPVCYSPCRSGLLKDGGTYLPCSSEGLMEGCIGGNVCMNGSCQPPGSVSTGAGTSSLTQAQTAGCENDSDCPDFQTCIQSACYSNCTTDDDCNDGRLCHRHVCRLPCNTVSSPCAGSDRVCLPEDGENGFCMPARRTSEGGFSQVEGTFTTSTSVLEFSNIKPDGSFFLSNEHPAPQDFVIRKFSHTGYGADGSVTVSADDGTPLYWIEVGKAGSPTKDAEFSVHVEPFSEVQIFLAEAGSVEETDLANRWEGVLRIENKQMGNRELLLTYRARPEGQWNGNMFYFASFRDKGIEQWLANGDTSGLENAFLVFWDEFTSGQRGLGEFQAALNATIDETWKLPWVNEYGNCSLAENACFPYNNVDGYAVYTQDLKDKPIPAGAVEFPIAMNLKQDGGPAVLKGKVVTDQTLHYAGDPEVTLQFEGDPAQCTANAKGVVICPLTGFGAQVLAGGRFQMADPADSGSCSDYAGATYDVYKTPWLVPGFEKGTAEVNGQLYRFECRDTMLPFGDPGGDNAKVMQNQSYAASNPIPDGRTRLRNVILVSGALVNGDELYIIFKENFESFMGPDDNEGFSAYGILHLSRTTAKLADEDFAGNSVAEDRTFDDDLLGIVCSQRLLDRIKDATGDAYDPDDPLDSDDLSKTLIEGGPDVGTADVIAAGDDEKVHWYCEDTGLIDGLVETSDNDYQVPCPEDSRVVYFTLTPMAAGAPADDGMIAALSCDNGFKANEIDYDVEIDEGEDGYYDAHDSFHHSVRVDVMTRGDCWSTLNQWMNESGDYDDGGPQPDYYIRQDPVWKCQDAGSVYCDMDRDDLRSGKDFFKKADISGVAFVNAYSAVQDVFRYKTRFRSRTGKNVGFTPTICQPRSDAIPYCYDPQGIEELAERIDCLTYLYTEHDADMSADVKQDVLDFLKTSFAYQTIDKDAAGNQLDVSIVYEGFERLNAELLIMLGDEAYTDSFASRFDLAGSGVRSFEGSLFEPPEGINLSGGAGFEMYSLYQATQYYQLALDRFYSLSPLIWKTLSTATVDSSFVTQETVTAYFDRLIRASTQKSRAWSEIANRYQQFNRPDLARRVVASAYTAAYLESVVLSRMMLKMRRVVELADWPQISHLVELAQRGYRSALRKMRNVYESISDNQSFFGYAPDYVPFPAMDPLDTNAFEKALDLGKDKLASARTKEEIALETSRSFDTDAEAFQSELVSIRNNYEGQLGDLCGTFEGDDGRIYAGIPKYAAMHDKLRFFPGDPCGLVGNGLIHEAMAEADLAFLGVKRARMDLDDQISEIKIEQERVENMCDLIEDTAEYVFDTAEEIIKHKDTIRRCRVARDATMRIMDHAEHIADMAKCSPLNGECAISTANLAILSAGYAAWEGIFIGLDSKLEYEEHQIDEEEQAMSKWQITRECDYARVDSDAKVRTFMLNLGSLHIELLKAIQRLQLASAKVVRLANKAKRLINEQSETEQLAINVAAARNDPNFRIYKNDAILTADRTFDEALKYAYRATRVYEYYTSQSYAPLEDLFLVRMVAHGDITLEAYLDQLEGEYISFEEHYGNPDLRVAVISLKNEVFDIERFDENNLPLTDGRRTQIMRDRISDSALLDSRGYITIPFATRLDDLSPLTRNHKVHYIEAQLLGGDLGDSVARVYLGQRGTGTVQGVDGKKSFYSFPERVAVLNAIVGEQRAFSGNVFEGDVYRNKRMRDMPLVNSNWELTINQRDERVNQDVNLQSLDDVRLYVYYTDFTEM